MELRTAFPNHTEAKRININVQRNNSSLQIEQQIFTFTELIRSLEIKFPYFEEEEMIFVYKSTHNAR